MKITRLSQTNSKSFLQAWHLYEQAFPMDERRDLDLQQQAMQNVNYHFDIVSIDGVFVGFILWWQFKGLRYIEHLATRMECRGKGYGKSIVEQFATESADQIILEVELPNNAISKRRIGFYQRLGFKLNQHDYKQLPMRKNGAEVEMLLMTYPNALTAQQLSFFKASYREMCYSILTNS
ncbi:GNAT family N-acetyltransferase [Ancylomarina sp. 16SWW S1-10-2]|uniref:GNAT family N-acetyltransferase n=1 Tax=Ancylomarina sp. 16SWW S1-10-2 TaxID=2499681 RepID=UPI0012AE96CE|nr:GNAT family N-acetyltransferase [Ancylomarina sp. 16SWW S1-10-2]MRT93662.1 GNAT family N-acetyltransferase [Ancylomarina sp. 16SWW S1-10-2]